MIQMHILRKRLKLLRLERDLKPVDMAAVLCIDTRNYLRIESGERKHISIAELDIICNHLGIDLGTFIKEISG